MKQEYGVSVLEMPGAEEVGRGAKSMSEPIDKDVLKLRVGW